MIGAGRVRSGLVWAALATALIVPVAVAARGLLLAWRDPVYVAADFAGVVALALLLVQPLLAGATCRALARSGRGGCMPGWGLRRWRRWRSMSGRCG